MCDQTSIQTNASGDRHHFDWVFNASATIASIYDKISIQVELAKEGSHIMVVAYGESGSGKTTTLFDGLGPDKGPTNHSIFHYITQALFELDQDSQWEVQVTWIESHMNTLFSLLHGDKVNGRQIQYHRSRTTVADLSNKPKDQTPFVFSEANDYFSFTAREGGRRYLHPMTVSSANQLQRLAQQAAKHRHVGSTTLNSKSSRSSVVLEMRLVHSGQPKGVITLLDMMGIEDIADKSGQQRFEASQGAQTNNGLSFLLDLFSKHATSQQHQTNTISNQPAGPVRAL